jgi:TDG/mug DNA glycosylase family protein
LPDYLRPGLRVLFVGINPGLKSAAVGHHFAGPSNRFWKLLNDSGLVGAPLTFREDWRLPEWGLGLTNVIERPTSGIDQLAPSEYRLGRRMLERKVARYRPQIVALLGVTIYRLIFSQESGYVASPSLGRTNLYIADIPVFLLPNPSGRNAHYSYPRMLRAFCQLRTLTAAQPASCRRR